VRGRKRNGEEEGERTKGNELEAGAGAGAGLHYIKPGPGYLGYLPSALCNIIIAAFLHPALSAHTYVMPMR
jgi:hypothetical protein